MNFEILLCNNVRTKVKQCLKIQLFVYHYFSCLFTFIIIVSAVCLRLQVSWLFTLASQLFVYICNNSVSCLFTFTSLHLQVSCLFTLASQLFVYICNNSVSCLFTFASQLFVYIYKFTFASQLFVYICNNSVSCLFTFASQLFVYLIIICLFTFSIALSAVCLFLK